MADPYFGWRLWQFSKDFQTEQSYVVGSIGNAGWKVISHQRRNSPGRVRWVDELDIPDANIRAAVLPTSNPSDKGWCATYSTIKFVTSLATCSKSYGKFFKSYESAKAWQTDRRTIVWCVTEDNVFQIAKTECDSSTGVSFPSESEARAEHLRLKNQSSTVATTSKSHPEGWIVRYGSFPSGEKAQEAKAILWGDNDIETNIELYKSDNQTRYRLYAGPFDDEDVAERMAGKIQLILGDPALAVFQEKDSSAPEPTTWNQATQVANAEKAANLKTEPKSEVEPEKHVSTEIVFWQSIKDSNDPEMFRAYLRNYPSGAFIDLAKIKIQKLTGSATSVAQASVPNLNYGNYHALVIGNNQYQNFKDLNTPINDARTVSRILRTSYGFKVDVLENATESEMFKAIVGLRSNVGRNDNVLIYFGGHGELDRDTEEGFWIPSDARRDDPSTYIPVDRIRKQIKAMSAKHVMVVADSCFSGSLTRSTLTRALKVKPRSPEYQTELQRIIDKKSRTALTSGGLEPVLDSGGDGHSVFASALISALRDNSGVLDAHELFIQIRKRVRNNSPQDPEYSPIYETGHDHGDFLFVRQSSVIPKQILPSDLEAAAIEVDEGRNETQASLELQDSDRRLAAQALQKALESTKDGAETDWQNPKTGNRGIAKPTKTIIRSDGTPCREFRTEVTNGRDLGVSRGEACRRADGSWKIQG